MKNWILKKMSYQELIEQLKAVRSLLYYYQRGRSYPEGTHCPLCVVAGKHHPKAISCRWCLWHIIENMNCGDFVDEKIGGGVGIVSATYLSEWYELRIPMLRRWGRVIQAEMDSRTCGEE